MGTAKYTKTTWISGSSPAVSATNLNNIENGIENANGVGALGSLTTGTGNTAVGTSALTSITNSSYCTAFGFESLKNNTSGIENTALGYKSMSLNTTGSSNTSIGNDSLYSNTTGYENTAIGQSSLLGNTTGNGNTAIGVNSISSFGFNGSYNVAVGKLSGYSLSTGSDNVFIGNHAGSDATTASSNVCIGYRSAEDLTTASGIVSIGNYAGFDNTTPTKYGTNSTMIGSYATTNNYYNSTALGYLSKVTGNNQIQLGNIDTTTYVYGTVQNRSDERDKADIRSTILGLEFIENLHPVDYRWDMREFYNAEQEKDGSKKRSRFHHGFIAQDIKKIIDETQNDFGGFQHHEIAGGKDVMTIGYDEFIAPMVKAIQELSAQVKQLQKELDTLKEV